MAIQEVGTGRIVYSEDVESLVFDWGVLHFLSAPDITGAERFSFGVVELAQGKGHESHAHPGVEEIIYVMSGEGEQVVDNHPAVHVRPGAAIFVPPDVPHSTINTGTDRLVLIVVYAPAGSERELREMPECQVLPPGVSPE